MPVKRRMPLSLLPCTSKAKTAPVPPGPVSPGPLPVLMM
jgi:hypothetical protein